MLQKRIWIDQHLQDNCCEDYDYEYQNIIDFSGVPRKPKKLQKGIVKLTQRYVAPQEDVNEPRLNRSENTRDFDRKSYNENSPKKVKYSLLDFNIYPTLHPPPFSENAVNVEQNIIESEFITTTTTSTTTSTTFTTTATSMRTTPAAAFDDTFYEDVTNVLDSDAEDDIYNKTDCPGNNLRVCVEACVPLPELWIYSVCVRECARRCP